MTGKRRRVVFVSQMYPPEKGGNPSRIHDNATHLREEGWDVTVLAPPPSYPPDEFERTTERASTETIDGITVHRLWTWQPRGDDPGMKSRLPYFLLFAVHAVVWLLRNVRRYDVVVTSTPPISTGAPGLLAAALGKPWVVDVRDLWIDASISLGYLDEGSLVERVSRRFQKTVLHTADRVLVTTEGNGRRLREAYGESLAEKTLLIPNGVDTATFHPSSDDASESDPTGATHVGVSDGGRSDARPTIVYTGNLGSAQDLDSCVRAMSHLSHETAVLKLVGNGDRKSDLRRLAAELGVEDRVEFTGTIPREEVPAVLDDATVGVAPLKDTDELAYAMPTKVYEYMACGLPTLVTGRGEVEQFVAESGGGVHAENDPERIAERLDELLADPERRRRLAEQGHEYVTTRYGRQAIASRFSDELADLVGVRAREGGRPVTQVGDA
jgi:glycosyltransferase involved in cell wall biosynthesis